MYFISHIVNKIMRRQGSYTNLSRGPMLFSTSTVSGESALDVFSSRTIPG